MPGLGVCKANSWLRKRTRVAGEGRYSLTGEVSSEGSSGGCREVTASLPDTGHNLEEGGREFFPAKPVFCNGVIRFAGDNALTFTSIRS
jgi:hypothetical protein